MRERLEQAIAEKRDSFLTTITADIEAGVVAWIVTAHMLDVGGENLMGVTRDPPAMAAQLEALLDAMPEQVKRMLALNSRGMLMLSLAYPPGVVPQVTPGVQWERWYAPDELRALGVELEERPDLNKHLLTAMGSLPTDA